MRQEKVFGDTFVHGLEGDTEGIFERETDWAARVGAVGEDCPDLEAVKALRKDGGSGFFGPNVLEMPMLEPPQQVLTMQGQETSSCSLSPFFSRKPEGVGI